MKDGVRIVNCARGELVDLEALEAGLESGKVGGAALDVFPTEPFTDHPLFGRDDVVVTPHLGASTAEAQDRAGTITADQVGGALSGGVVTNAVNIAAVRPETMEALAPFVPLCEKLGRLAQGLGNGLRRSDRPPSSAAGIAEHDTRLLGIAVLVGILSGSHRGAGQPRQRTGPGRGARHRPDRDQGRRSPTSSRSWSPCGSSPATTRSRSPGTAVGPRNLPHLVRVWGERFYMPFADHLVVFRYKDQPGMIGRVGTIFGEHGVNIVSAAVGRGGLGRRRGPGAHHRRPGARRAPRGDPRLEGFRAGRAVDF